MKETNNGLGSCPAPVFPRDAIVLGHGSGGRLTRRLLDDVILPAFQNPILDSGHDAAVIEAGGARFAFTTDSYIVHPIVFPGGDIGDLAINGTVNDLAMCGARPLYLSAALILEEGFPMEALHRVVHSMRRAADAAGVLLVTGDTKVVDRGKGDGVFINTSGIGVVPGHVRIDPSRAAPGDVVIVSGAIASHGMAIMSVREGLEFESPIESDTAPLNDLVAAILAVAPDTHVLRDPTRGGVASALNEIAAKSRCGIALNEDAIPIDPATEGACEILGLDPLYVANEGKLIAIVAPEEAAAALDAMRGHPLGLRAEIIGEVTARDPGIVVMKTRVGSTRIVDMLSGEQLPRIC
ncbi:MAG TPA: hydrogenase expression/formation protein HypE [Terriglobia bacterium]|nr:hydrogenase expression/formation protein HypE [Terriglobia bacterium]